MRLSTEEWRPIPGYEGLYSVSDLGRVCGEQRQVQGKLGSTRTLPRKLLAATSDSSGYLQVRLRKDGTGKMHKVAHLVAAAFIGPRPTGQEVAHGNGIRTDNRRDNLRYDTREGNQADRLLHGTDHRGERSPRAKLTAEQVVAIRSDSRSNRKLAAVYGVHHSVIWGIRNGRGWQ